MSFWLIVLGSVFLAAAGCAVYLVTRILKFDLFARVYAKKKMQGILYALLVLIVPLLLIAVWMGALNMMICAIHLAIIWMVCDLAARIITKKKAGGQKPYYAGFCAIALTLIYLSIAFVLAHTVTPTEYSLRTDKEIEPVRIIQISDAHIGTTFGSKGFTAAVEKMKAYNPDIVVITGDFVDDGTGEEEFKKCCEALGSMNPRYGIYYVFGNHDKSFASSMLRENGRADVMAELEKNGVKVLEDEVVPVGEDIYVIGRQDASTKGRGAGRKSTAELVTGLYSDRYKVVLDHQPCDYEAQEAAGVDLVLSGHTHGGQMFPLKPLVGLLGGNECVYGHERRGTTDFIVTSGISDWEIQFKSGCRAEFVVIDVKYGDDEDEGEVLERDAKVTIGDLEKEISQSMPVIAIQTKKVTTNSLRFIDAPVSRHVAEDIATWTPNYVIPPEPYYVKCRVSLLDTDGSIAIDNADADVKVRGNWTTSYPKKPLRIKFTEKKNLLGMNDGQEFKNWILLAEYKDGSMLRDKVSFQIANAILGEDGLYASDARLVSVVVNGSYRGVYLLVEQQEVKGGRVNITDVKKDYTGTDIGYLLEMDGYYMSEDELHRFHVDYNNNAPLTPYDGNGGSGKVIKCLPKGNNGAVKDIGFTIKSTINSKRQTDFIANFVENVYTVMYKAAYLNESYVFNDGYTTLVKTTDITPREAIERVVDVNSLADMYIISELTCDADIYWSSFYISVDFGPDGNKKLTFQAPWDFDSGLGNKNRCEDGTGYYAANIVPDVNGYTDYGGSYKTVNPWLAVLAYQDWYMDIVRDKWNRAVDNGVFTDALTMIEHDTQTCEDEFVRNYGKWDNLINNDDFVGELSRRARSCRTQRAAADYLQEWLDNRVQFLDGEWGEVRPQYTVSID